MDKLLVLWLTTLCTIVCAWFYLNNNMEIDYMRHPQLVDQETGVIKKPSEMLKLSKVIKITEDYINSTNAQERLYDLEYHLNFENPFLLDYSYSSKKQLIMSGWPVSNQTKCGQQLNWIVKNLELHPNYTFERGSLGFELTNLLDSFGKIESGHYSGAFNWLGSHRLCEKVSLNRDRIKTRYCIAKMRPKWWPKNETIYPKTRIRLGLCLPETCDTLSFNEHKEFIEKLAKFNLPKLYQDGLDFDSLFCLPDERSPIRQIPTSGYIYLSIVFTWLMIVSIGTIFHELWFHKRRIMRTKSQQKANDNAMTISNNRVICDFDIKMFKIDIHSTENGFTKSIDKKKSSSLSLSSKNFGAELFKDICDAISLRSCLKSFTSNNFRVNYNQGHRVKVDLGALDSIKCAMTLLVILGHSGYLSSIYSRSLAYRIELNSGITGRLALSISRCVDTFFIFFGLLTTYTLMNKVTLKQLSNPLLWLGINFGVLTRVTPLFMTIYWYSKSISPYLGSGPWWDYGVDQYSMKGVCMSDSWWKSIPYFGSIGMPPVPACLLPGWFLVSYSQISLLLPMITYIIWKLPNYLTKFLLIAFLMVTSTLSVCLKLYNQTSINEEGFTIYGGFLADLLEKFESTGNMTTFARLGGVSIGCLIGYLLRMYELGKIKRWPAIIRSNTTTIVNIILHTIIVFLPTLGAFNLINLKEFVSFNFLITIIWPILNLQLIIFATTVYNHKAIVRFLSHSFWHTFSKLGLAIYLVHWEVIFIATTSHDEAPTYGYLTDVMKMWAFGIFISILLAFVLHITIEVPISRLILLIYKRNVVKKISETSVNDTNKFESSS